MKLDELGRFWMAGYEDDMVSGRLTFDKGGGIQLEIVGTFDHYDGKQCSIQGWIGSRRVSLFECFQTLHRLPSPGIASAAFHSNFMLIGYHLADTDLHFQSVSVEFSHLAEWVNQPGWDEIEEAPTRHTVRFALGDRAAADFSQGRLVQHFRQRYERGRDVDGIVLGQHPVMSVEYNETKSLQTIRRDVGRIESLLIMCLDRPAEVDLMVLRRLDIPARMMSGDDAGYPEDIELWASPLHHVPAEDRPYVWPHEMLLTFDQLGGVEAIARWLDVSRPFQSVLDSMLSIHRRKMFMENRFLNVVGAAEAFHRLTNPAIPQEEFDALSTKLMAVTPPEHQEWLQGKIGYALEPSLRRRMLDLVRRSGEATAEVTGATSRAKADPQPLQRFGTG